jgi:RNA polymerase sigma-70 factor (ECF subfamily)
MGVMTASLAEGARVASGGLFESIFTRHYPRVHRVLSGLVGPDEADDAAQEVFLRLYHSRLLDKPDEQIAAWLYRVAVNTSYNLLRSRRRQAAHVQRAGRLAQSEAAIGQAALNPAQAVADAEQAALVRAALDHLSPTHRAVLALRQAGLSYAEVAAAAGVKPGSVGTLLARAESHLRDVYLRLAGDRPAGHRPAHDPGDRP